MTGPYELGEETLNALMTASQALVAVSVRSILGSTDVTVAQYRMLVVVDRQDCNLTELAAALDVAPSTAMRMVDRLEDAGYLRRQVRPENRRETLLCLTDTGSSLVTEATQRRRRELAEVVDRVPVADRAALTRAAALLAESAGMFRLTAST